MGNVLLSHPIERRDSAVDRRVAKIDDAVEIEKYALQIRTVHNITRTGRSRPAAALAPQTVWV
jgi:hypothetical protein